MQADQALLRGLDSFGAAAAAKLAPFLDQIDPSPCLSSFNFSHPFPISHASPAGLSTAVKFWTPSSHSCQILAFSAVGKDLKGQLPSHPLLITNPHIFSKITFTSSPNGWHKSKQFHLRLSSWGERIEFVMRYCHWSISFLHTPSHYTLRTTLHPPLAYTLSSVCYLLHQVFHLDAALVGQSRSSHQCCLCIRALYYILRHLRLEQQSLHQHISHDCVVNLIYY